MSSIDFGSLLRQYETELLDNVIPWWMKHGIDWEKGGPTEAIYEDGRVASYDKTIWSLGRALFVWSRLYNLIGQRHEWLNVANRIFDFLLPIGAKNDWVWPGKVDREGSVIEPSTAVYADGFAIMGLTEYALATGSPEAIKAAVATFDSLLPRMAELGPHLATPEAISDRARCHGISMLFSTVFHELGKLVDDPAILQAGYEHAVLIQDLFLKPDRRMVLEYTALDGSELEPPHGRVLIPGHTIESMWFGIHIFQDRCEAQRIARAVEAIKWHMELSWDSRYGGMLHIADAYGENSPELLSSNKIMWPHTEALYALLLAYEVSGEQWCLDWYQKVHDWSWKHLPVPVHGEWHRQVATDGSPLPDPSRPGGQPRKEPFHLPRALIMCVDVLQRLAAQSAQDRRTAPEDEVMWP